MNISSINFRVSDMTNSFKIGTKNSISEIDNQNLVSGLTYPQNKSANPTQSSSILHQINPQNYIENHQQNRNNNSMLVVKRIGHT